MKAMGYIRVSTEGQAADGVSLEAQRGRIEAWADANGYDLEYVAVDAGISGGRAANRPGLQEAISRACSQKAALVVYSLSRLARSTRDALEISEKLDKAGADLVSLTERIDTTSAAGKMVFRMLAVLAEFERDLVSERTRAAMGHMRTRQRRISREIPFGYDLSEDGESLNENAREQAAIALMRSLREAGLSLRQIAAELDKRGVRTKNGNPWQARTISNILKRAA